jgi:cell shape-determining protein MreC
MNSLLRNKPEKHIRKKVILFCIVCGVCIGLRILFPSVLTTLCLSVSRPLWSVRDNTFSGIRYITGYFKDKQNLIKQNTALREAVYNASIKEVEYTRVLSEYEDLTLRVYATTTASTDSVARVISKPPFTPYDMFIIDKGKEGGITVGDTVYVNDALIVGYVSFVSDTFSHVTLFSTGGESREVYIERTHTPVTLVGKGGGNFQMSLPKDFDIVVGDTLVYAPGIHTAIMAEVFAEDTTPTNSFKTVYARVPQHIFQTYWVTVRGV